MRLPPLVLDDDQAVAVAVALQTAPAAVTGLEDGVRRALTTITRVLPERLRAQVEALHLTAIENSWAFAAPPVASATLTTVGAAVRRQEVLVFDYRTEDGRRPEPGDPDFVPPHRVEPHHVVLWAGRWYLVGYALGTTGDDGAGGWRIYRVDRIQSLTGGGARFERRAPPFPSVAEYVVTSHDRGDTLAAWPCRGSAVLDHPADVVARWAPGGSVIESVGGSFPAQPRGLVVGRCRGHPDHLRQRTARGRTGEAARHAVRPLTSAGAGGEPRWTRGGVAGLSDSAATVLHFRCRT